MRGTDVTNHISSLQDRLARIRSPGGPVYFISRRLQGTRPHTNAKRTLQYVLSLCSMRVQQSQGLGLTRQIAFPFFRTAWMVYEAQSSQFASSRDASKALALTRPTQSPCQTLQGGTARGKPNRQRFFFFFFFFFFYFLCLHTLWYQQTI